MIEDAISQGWDREVERHRCATKRIEQLLEELGEPLEMIDELNNQGSAKRTAVTFNVEQR